MEECQGDSLPAGATAERLAELQAIAGVEVPAGVLASLARHDGSGEQGYLANWRLLATDEIGRIYQALLGKPVTDDYLDRYPWKMGWLPLAIDRAGNLMCLNLDPDTDSDDDEVRQGVPLDFTALGEMFSLWQDENRVVPQYMTFEEWLEELVEEASEE
jgi:cell wall assembly regulator SMI1